MNGPSSSSWRGESQTKWLGDTNSSSPQKTPVAKKRMWSIKRYCTTRNNVSGVLIFILLGSVVLIIQFHVRFGKLLIAANPNIDNWVSSNTNNYQNCDPSKSKLEDVGKTVLVTGGAGFIGMFTSIQLKEHGYNVIAIDNMNGYYSIKLKNDRVEQLKQNNVTFIEGDICDEGKLVDVMKTHKVDRIIHLAAQAGIGYSLTNPRSYTKNNVDCFVNVLESFVKQGLHDLNKPIVYASSSSVYGSSSNPPFSEDISEVDKPVSLYAATKRSDELIAYTYNRLYKVRSVGLRFFTVYGPWGRPDMSPMIFADKVVKDETMSLTNYGKSVRDFTYVSDIVNGVIAALEYSTEEAEIFNLGGSNPIELTYYVKLIEGGLGKKAKMELVPMRKGDVPVTSADVSKAKCHLGWEPVVPIEIGMKKFLKWFNEKDASKNYMSKVI